MQVLWLVLAGIGGGDQAGGHERQQQGGRAGIGPQDFGAAERQPLVKDMKDGVADHLNADGRKRRLPRLPALNGGGFRGYGWTADAAAAVTAAAAVGSAAAEVPFGAALEPFPSATSRSSGA